MGRDRLGGDSAHAVFVDNDDNSRWVEPRWEDGDEWVVQVQGPDAHEYDRRTFPSRRAAFEHAERFMYDHMHGLGPSNEFDFSGVL